MPSTTSASNELPSSSSSSTLSESALAELDKPCKSPDWPPDLAPSPFGSKATDPTGWLFPRATRFFSAAFFFTFLTFFTGTAFFVTAAFDAFFAITVFLMTFFVLVFFLVFFLSFIFPSYPLSVSFLLHSVWSIREEHGQAFRSE